MHNGYFTELDEIRSEDPGADFSFLENMFSETGVNAFRFLHGYCYTFASELSRRCGYQIETLRDRDGDLIHAYCVTMIDDKPAYIDIRGITTDPREFFVAFDDLVSSDYENVHRMRFSDHLTFEQANPDLDCLELLPDACAFLDENPRFYHAGFLQRSSKMPALSNIIRNASNRSMAALKQALHVKDQESPNRSIGSKER